jgi:hypothetical protein
MHIFGKTIQNRLENKDFSLLFFMFIFLDFSLNTGRAIKKGRGEISKTEYAVFVYSKLESIYKKSSKFEEVRVQNLKKCLISNGMSPVS